MSLNLLAYVLETTRPALNMASCCFSGFYDISLSLFFLSFSFSFVYFLRLALIISRPPPPLCFLFVPRANSSLISADSCVLLSLNSYSRRVYCYPFLFATPLAKNTWRGMRDLASLAAVFRLATKKLSIDKSQSPQKLFNNI